MIFIPKSNKYLLLIGTLAIILGYCFWLFLGENSMVVINDNLDHEFVFLELLTKNHLVLDYSNTRLDCIMEGIPRNAFRSGLNLTFLIYILFSPITAYIINHFIVHLIGFTGMYLFSQQYIKPESNKISFIISILFSLISYYHIQYGISISGQPLLLFAFLNILNGDNKWYNWIVIVTFPFFSFLFVTLPFFLPFLIVIGLSKYFKTNKIPKKYIMAIVLLVLFYCIVEFPILQAVFSKSSTFISHREAYNKFLLSPKPSLLETLSKFTSYLFSTTGLAGKMTTIPILILFAFSWIINKNKSKLSLYFFLSIIFCCLADAICDLILFYFQDKISVLKFFTIERFNYLGPFLYIALMGTAISSLSLSNLKHKLLLVLLVSIQFTNIILNNSEVLLNGKILLGLGTRHPTFKQFYANDLFNEIKNTIEKPQNEYKVVSVGIYPNIAQFNGFYTLDSYQNNYPLEYKNKFRPVIEKELNKNSELKGYFDGWGSRCYIFSSELAFDYLSSKKSLRTIKKLEINTKLLYEMNCEFVLCALPIGNYKDLNLKFIKAFENNDSYWKIYLYKIIPH